MEKWALVTGASGDIGKAIAKMLASNGYGLYLHYNEDENSILGLKRELRTTIKVIRADLSHISGIETLLGEITDDIECIVHNAGSSYYGLFTDMSDLDIQQMVTLHITSPTLLTKKLVPSMIAKKNGKIIYITSIWGQIGASCEVVYSMVKGAQATFVKALAKELAPSGIYVNGVAPGAIQTKMLASFSMDELGELANDIPMGRLGTPTEVADAVEFLISSKASYVNGQILSLNGGWTA